MVGFAPIRMNMRRRGARPLGIQYHVGHGTLTPLFESLNAIGAQVHRMSIVEQEGTRQLDCELVGVGSEALDEIVSSLRARAEVISVTTAVD